MKASKTIIIKNGRAAGLDFFRLADVPLFLGLGGDVAVFLFDDGMILSPLFIFDYFTSKEPLCKKFILFRRKPAQPIPR
jgi:hypothetical protein